MSSFPFIFSSLNARPHFFFSPSNECGLSSYAHWTLRSLNESVFKEINPEQSLEELIQDEVPLLWQHDVKSWLTGKYPDAGKDWKQKEKRGTEDEMSPDGCPTDSDGNTDSMDMNLGILWEMGTQRVGQDWSDWACMHKHLITYFISI